MLSVKGKFIIFFLFFTTAIITATAAFCQDKYEDVRNGVSEVAGWKARAEARASAIKNRYKPQSKEYNSALILYSDAKSAVDHWIIYTKSELLLGKKVSSGISEKELKDVSTKVDRFITYVDSLTFKVKGPSLASTVLQSFADLTSNLIKLYDERRKEKIDSAKELLGEVKWKDFKDL